MNDLREQLRRADPLAHESPLGAADVREMRQRLLAVVPSRRPARLAVRELIAAVGFAVFCLAVGSLVRVAMSHSEPKRVSVRAATADASAVTRVYFETASGIRVVWIFDSGSEERPQR
jgi:hypothetical protein